jgi:hypothetical protein
MTPIVLTAIITADQAQFFAGDTVSPAELFYPLGGGVHQKEGGGSYSVRTLALRADGPPDGVDAVKWQIPGGLYLLEAASASASLAGKRITITIEEEAA